MNILWQKANQQVQIDFNLSHQVNRNRILRLHEGRTHIDAMVLDLAILWMEMGTRQFTTGWF